jgi:hypothetical protein
MESLLGENGLSVAIEPEEGNPDMPNSVPGMTHWSVNIEGGKMPVHYRVSLLRENGGDAPPSVGEALEFLRSDLHHPRLDDDTPEWLAVHGIPEDGEAAGRWARAHEALVDLRAAVCEHLPPDVAQALSGVEARRPALGAA